jgi:hypothetical protein
MKAIRQYSGLTIEVEARDQTELFETLAQMDEVFGDLVAQANIDGHLVTSDDVSFVVRHDNERNKYYEIKCNSGPLQYYKKRFGQHQTGRTLFPRTKPAEGEVAGLNGWSKYVANGRQAVANDDF